MEYATSGIQIVLLAIKEISHNSAAGPDGIPASLLINCAVELAHIQCKLFKHTFSEEFIPPPLFQESSPCSCFQGR